MAARSHKTARFIFTIYTRIRFAPVGVLFTYLCDRFPADFVLLLVNNVQWNGTVLSRQRCICLDS